MSGPKVEIRGIRELASAFKRVDKEIVVQLKAEFKEIAQHVVGIVQQRMPIRTGRAASSVKPRSSQKGAGIAFGGARAEYMPWLDFGGRVGRKKSIYREVVRPGRYVYPAISQEREETEAAAYAAVEHAARSAGFDWNDL